MTIRSNERIAREIEGLIAQKLNGKLALSRRGPYDIETLDSLVEVKSCRVKTKGRKKGRKTQYLQKGRFIIASNSHSKLKAEAEAIGKKATYIFALYRVDSSPKILQTKELLWREVDNLLAKGYSYTRKDGTTFILLDYTKLFLPTDSCHIKP